MHKIVWLLLLTACGYHWQEPSLLGHRPSINISFITGDEDGLFTHELVQAITASGVANVSLREGDYRLDVSILRTAGERTGFRKDQQKVDGKIQRYMVACEARKIVAIEAVLCAPGTDEVVFGPYQIEADVDFDCIDQDSYKDLTFINPHGVAQAVLPFSLGQLEPYEAAQRAAARSLYAQLAQKIVDVIILRPR
ncbi:MAG: hypothetical protein K2X08_02790 [Chlamydiales bacterium]|nr:hypothetical protein [Chlamydiales bacterium]